MPVTCDVHKAYPLGPTELRRLRLLRPSPAAARVYAWIVPPSKQERREALKAVYHQARDCTRCPQLAATRTTVVFGSGNADADLMFVGEAPGRNEDEQGLPFVGQAGKLLDKLLEEIGLPARRRLHRQHAEVPPARQPRSPSRGDRELPRVPPAPGRAHRAARDLHAGELRHQAPARATRPGSRACTGARRCASSATRAVRLYPIFHPAAALYTPANVEVLRTDFARLPELLAMAPPPQPGARSAGAPRPCPSRARCRTSPSSSPWPWRSTTARWGCSDGPPVGGDRLRALGRGLRARAARVPARGDRVAGARSSTCAPGGRWSTSPPAAASSPGRWRRWAAR